MTDTNERCMHDMVKAWCAWCSPPAPKPTKPIKPKRLTRR